MRPKHLPILATLLWLSVALAAVAQPASVIGIAQDDTLNMRANIDTVDEFSDAPVVASLAPGAAVLATGRAYMLDQALWREVRNGETLGWVNARFLRFEAAFPDTARFRCGGTEPFWDIAFDEVAGQVTQMNEPGVLSLITDSWAGALGRPYVRSYRFRRANGGAPIIGIVALSQQCSDGMSDIEFAYDFYLLGLDSMDGLYSGCCMLD